MRVVVADDSLLIREGLTRLLGSRGIDVVGVACDATELLALVGLEDPDAAIVDVRMPPTFATEGIDASNSLAATHPDLAVLILSQHLELSYARILIEGSTGRRGYLLKERVLDADYLVSALYRIVAGDMVVDHEAIADAVAAPAVARRLAALTDREVEVLGLLAEGLSDRGVCDRLVLSPKTVATHVQHIFTKLGLPSDATTNRRIHAVLAYLSPDFFDAPPRSADRSGDVQRRPPRMGPREHGRADR